MKNGLDGPNAPTTEPTGDPFLDRPWENPQAEPFVRIERLGKSFDGVPVVRDVSLDIHRGEIFSLLGGSGSGKTTLLRMLAGLEQPDHGRILIAGQDMTRVPPHRRPVNMMFQSYALFPHMSVAENIAFGLIEERLPRPEIRERVAEALDLVSLSDFARRRPDQLSGGQRQRVALARCLVKRPKLLLLDEPMAALDKTLRERTQYELARIQERVGITFVMVTHDQQEAMAMSSRIAVMDEGRLLQVGTPQEIYEFPASSAIARFVGTVNLFDGRILEVDGGCTLVDVPALGSRVRLDHGIDLPQQNMIRIAIRPEKMQIERAEATDETKDKVNRVVGVIEEITYLGIASTYHVRLSTGALLRVHQPIRTREAQLELKWDDTVRVSWHPSAPVALVD
ncbi:MAG: ABC transporter ATP-binding protein [Alphaproteobacteria bacterium]|nr:MAG: ABC transporter ATP-binding protein [Alphaproteobacteria bacterium]